MNGNMEDGWRNESELELESMKVNEWMDRLE